MIRARPTAGGHPVDALEPAPAAMAAGAIESTATIGKIMCAVAVLAFAGASVAVDFGDAVAVVAIACAVLLLGFLRSPAIGMLAIVWLAVMDVPFRIYVLGEYSLPYNTINYLLLAVGVFSLPPLLGAKIAPAKWLLALLVVGMLQIPQSSNYELGMVLILELAAALALIGAVVHWGADDDVLYWTAVVAGVTGAVCVLAYLLRRPEVLLNTNSLAQVPLTGMTAIAIAAARTGVIRNWPLIAALTTANVVLLFLTESRGNFVLGVILGIFIILRSPGVLQKVLAVSLFAGLFIWATATFAAEVGTTADKWARFMDPDVSFSQSTNRRLDLAEVGWGIFLENPLGLGTGSFTDFEGYTLGNNMAHIPRAAHSAWVKTMAENGVPGLFLLTGFVVAFVSMRNRTDARVSRAFGPLTACLLTLGFLGVEFQSKALWLLAGGAAAILHERGALPQQAARRRPTVAGAPDRGQDRK